MGDGGKESATALVSSRATVCKAAMAEETATSVGLAVVGLLAVRPKHAAGGGWVGGLGPLAFGARPKERAEPGEPGGDP